MQFELEKFLPYRLSLLTNTVSQGIARHYRARHRISVTEWRLLAVLGRYPGLTASETVERTAMDKVAVHRAVKNLEQRRLVNRVEDSRDRRRLMLTLSGKGRSLLKKILPEAREYERSLLSVLSKKETAELDRLLTKLQEQADRLKSGR